MPYLMVENLGTADLAAFTLLGVSTTRYSDSNETIGMFGSGNKHAMCIMLRHGIKPILYISNLRAEFQTVTQKVSGIGSSREYNRVQYKLTGKDADGRQVNRTEDTGFVTEFGAIDWDELGMGLREIISNAIDASKEASGSIASVKVELVDDNQVRAKAGYTRVFIEATSPVMQYHSEIKQRFLHFTESNVYEDKLLPAHETQENALLYRRGVLVGTSAEKSLFNYNLRDVELDESRNVKSYAADRAASRVLLRAPHEKIVQFLLSLTGDNNLWEHTFNAHDFGISWLDKEEHETLSATWIGAWRAAYGKKAVACMSIDHHKAAVLRKGYVPIIIGHLGTEAVLRGLGIPTALALLTKFESDGTEIEEAPTHIKKVADTIWDKIAGFKLTNGKQMPEMHVFHKIMEGESMGMGFYRGGAVYINKDMSQSNTFLLRQTILEEFGHHITGATDNSRDFQDWAFRLAMMSLDGGAPAVVEVMDDAPEMIA